MAGGFRPQPADGLEKLKKQLNDSQRATNSLRTQALLRNSSITGGNGLTVGNPAVAPWTRLFANEATQQGRIVFNPSAADQQQDWGASVWFQEAIGTGAGSLNLNSPAAPESRFDNQPAQVSTVTLNSGDGVADQGSIYLSSGDGRSDISTRGGRTGLIQPRITLGNAYIEDDGFAGTQLFKLFAGLGSLVFPYTVAEARIRDATNSAYIPIRASAFTVTSTAAAKQNIRDLGWSPLDVVLRAKAKAWNYRDTEGDPARQHIGPMAEDLPSELVDNTSETPALDLGVLVGVLWGAVQELAAEVAALRDVHQAADPAT